MAPRQDDHEPAQPVSRKPYVRPEVEQVRLVLDEAVLGSGCKTSGMSGPNQTGSCEINFTPCTVPGS
jgi:hypothetical protein